MIGTETKWPELLKAYCNLALTKNEMVLWWDEIRRKITNVTNEEIYDAIRAASERNRDKFAGKPDLRDIRIWVYMLRKARRQESGLTDADDSCEACDHGWIAVPYPRDHEYDGQEFVVPCRCDRGRVVLDREYDPNEQTTLVRIATDRLAELAELGETGEK